jgi:hypothetical protein
VVKEVDQDVDPQAEKVVVRVVKALEVRGARVKVMARVKEKEKAAKAKAKEREKEREVQKVDPKWL